MTCEETNRESTSADVLRVLGWFFFDVPVVCLAYEF